MTKFVTAKFVLKALLAIAIGVFLAFLEESKRKIVAALPDLAFLKLVRSTSVDYYSGEIVYNVVGAGAVTGGVSGASHILMMHGTSPSLVSVPIKDVIALIKWRLAVREYGDFAARKGMGMEVEGGGCAVCWERIEKKDEIREMANCSHAFHRDCVDRWLDEGHITCPLCRSSLIPPNTNPWRILAESDSMVSLQDPE